jgi:carbonic anhydrase/acetyltransferase-like protein (isoleucine patch superfamily)
MLRVNVVKDMPQVDSTSYVDPDAIIIGRVIVGAHCFIGAGAVIRADRFSTDDQDCRITIGDGCVLQDGVILHAHATSIKVGTGTILNHGVVIHGPATVGDNCFIGCKAILHCAHINSNVFVRSNCVVESVTIPADRFIEIGSCITLQEDVERLRPITGEEKKFMMRAVEESRDYPIRYKYSLEM